MIDERLWSSREDLGETWLEWGSYAYGKGAEGSFARRSLEQRIRHVEVIVQNQDNAEHDLLDSDDYYSSRAERSRRSPACRAGNGPSTTMICPVRTSGHSGPWRKRSAASSDHGSSIRKWITGVMRHGYKGAFEIAATIDYLFAFAATTGAVRNHHFDLVYDACLGDDEVRAFISEHNLPALREIAGRLNEALDRNLWNPRSNSARARVAALGTNGLSQ